MKKKKVKNKLDLILSLEKKQLKEQRKIEDLEKKQILEVKEIDVDEKQVSQLEKKQLSKLNELEALEKKIKQGLGDHPLRRITYKDLGKATIGAFIGIVSHFTVLEGLHFAENISIVKANVFFLISFLIGLIMVYYSGFRRVKDARLFAFLPVRLIFIYVVTLFAILISLFIFGAQTLSYTEMYKQISVLSLPAIIGACAADLIGGE